MGEGWSVEVEEAGGVGAEDGIQAVLREVPRGDACGVFRGGGPGPVAAEVEVLHGMLVGETLDDGLDAGGGLEGEVDADGLAK